MSGNKGFLEGFTVSHDENAYREEMEKTEPTVVDWFETEDGGVFFDEDNLPVLYLVDNELYDYTDKTVTAIFQMTKNAYIVKK